MSWFSKEDPRDDICKSCKSLIDDFNSFNYPPHFANIAKHLIGLCSKECTQLYHKQLKQEAIEEPMIIIEQEALRRIEKENFEQAVQARMLELKNDIRIESGNIYCTNSSGVKVQITDGGELK